MAKQKKTDGYGLQAAQTPARRRQSAGDLDFADLIQTRAPLGGAKPAPQETAETEAAEVEVAVEQPDPSKARARVAARGPGQPGRGKAMPPDRANEVTYEVETATYWPVIATEDERLNGFTNSAALDADCATEIVAFVNCLRDILGEADVAGFVKHDPHHRSATINTNTEPLHHLERLAIRAALPIFIAKLKTGALSDDEIGDLRLLVRRTIFPTSRLREELDKAEAVARAQRAKDKAEQERAERLHKKAVAGVAADEKKAHADAVALKLAALTEFVAKA